MQVLFIGKKSVTIYGGSIVADRNLSLFKDIYGYNEVYFLGLDYKSKVSKVFNSMFNYPMGYSKNGYNEICYYIEDLNIQIIYLDNSLFGGFAKMLKLQYPNLKIITFFHNVEFVYFKNKVRLEGYLNLIMQRLAWHNEKAAIKYSDYLITLSERDSVSLQSLYGRKANLVLPIGMKDAFSLYDSLNSNQFSKRPIALFVGSDNFANLEGISWFIENVCNKLNCEVWVVGKGMEVLRDKYSNVENLKIEGFVDNLSDYYYAASLFINPVFSGSGMKTKTVEAIMYGKYIFGTDEAFVGFDFDCEKIGRRCNTGEEFITGINNFLNLSKPKFNQYARDYFINNYENNVLGKKLLNFLINEGLISDSRICI